MKNSKYSVGLSGDTFCLYLFQLIFVRPDFNCPRSFAYLESIRLQMVHKVLYQLLQDFSENYLDIWLVWIVILNCYLFKQISINLYIVYSAYATSKWRTIFKYNLFFSIIWCCSCSFCNCYSSFNKYLRISIIT